MASSNGKQRKNSGAVPDNLKPHAFAPGRSGNLKGRPKGSVDIWARVRAKLREKAKQGPMAGREYADLVANAIVKAAVKGRWPQTKELLDREHGKPAETVEHSGGMKIEVTYRTRPSVLSNGNGRIAEHANGNGHPN